MSDTGAKYPATKTTQAVAPESSDNWVNIANIGADDGVYAYITAATYDTNDICYRAKAQGFDFSAIPDGATIDGILVEIERRCAAGAAKDYRVQLLDASGALVGDNKADTVNAWPGTDTVKSYGEATDKWNASPTVAMVKDADFGVVLSVQATADNTDIYVDFIRITIYYTVQVVNGTMNAALCTATALTYDGGLTGGATIACALPTASALAYEAVYSGSASWDGAVALADASSPNADIGVYGTLEAALALATALGYASTLTGTALMEAAVALASALSPEATCSADALLVGALATAVAESYSGELTGAAVMEAVTSLANATSPAAVYSGNVSLAGVLAEATALAFAAELIGGEGGGPGFAWSTGRWFRR
jgi:hypothetical protein